MYSPKPSLLRFPPQSFHFTIAHPTPSSSCTQMHIPPQLLTLLCLSGNLNVLKACPFMLRHNVACNGWPPLGLPATLNCQPFLCVCDVISECFQEELGGEQGCRALYFFLHPSFCFCSVEWLIKKKKAPVHSFLPIQGLANMKAALERGGQKDTHVTR